MNAQTKLPGFFAAAATLARKGYYPEALASLQRAWEAKECQPAEALDLQARILAQQGLYLDAERCWKEAMALDGGNPHYARALARLHEPAVPTARAALVVGAAAFGVIVLALLIWQALIVGPGLERQLAAAQSASGQLRQVLADTSAEGRVALAALGQDMLTRLAAVEDRAVASSQGVEQGLASLAARMQRYEDTVLNGVGGGLAALEGRLDRLDETTSEALENSRSGAAQVDRRLERLDAELTMTVADALAGLTKAGSVLADRVAAMHSHLQQAERQQDLDRQALARMDEFAETTSGMLAALQSELASTARRQQSLMQQLGRIDEAANTRTQVLNAAVAGMDDLPGAMETIVANRLDAFEERLQRALQAEHGARLSSLGEAVQFLRADLQALHQNLESFRQELAARGAGLAPE